MLSANKEEWIILNSVKFLRKSMWYYSNKTNGIHKP